MKIIKNENAIIAFVGLIFLSVFSVFTWSDQEVPLSIEDVTVGMPFSVVKPSLPEEIIVQWDQHYQAYHVKNEKKEWVFNQDGLLIQIQVTENGYGIDSMVKVGDPEPVLTKVMGNPDASYSHGFIYRYKSYSLSFDLENKKISKITMKKNPTLSTQIDSMESVLIHNYYEHSKIKTSAYLQQLAKILAQFDIYFIDKHLHPEKKMITVFDLYRNMYHDLTALPPPEGMKIFHALLTQSYELEVKKIELYERYANHQLNLETFHRMTDEIQFEINKQRTAAFLFLFEIETYADSKNLYNELRNLQEQYTESIKKSMSFDHYHNINECICCIFHKLDWNHIPINSV